jgi:hypothetical protein
MEKLPSKWLAIANREDWYDKFLDHSSVAKGIGGQSEGFLLLKWLQ